MQRIALLCLLLALTSACAPLTQPPLPTGEGMGGEGITPTATFIPTFTPTPAETSTPTPVPVWTIFKDNSDFLSALIKQDRESSKHFSVEDGKTYLAVTGPAGVALRVEVDPSSGKENVDVNGGELQVEDTGNENPLTIRGVGKDADKVYSFIPETTITLNDQGDTKTFPAHWAEVVKQKYIYDELHNKDGSWNLERLTEQINNPVRFTVAQVQNGEFARSVLLSGYMRPVPDDIKFGGPALWHGPSENYGPYTQLLFSGGQHIPFYAVASVGGQDIGVRPISIWNPKDQENPDRRQQLILNLGIGTADLDEQSNNAYLNFAFFQIHNPVILVQAEKIGKDSYEELDWIPRESRLALQNLPGNDPVDIGYLGGIISRRNSDPTTNPELWQVHRTDPFPEELQMIIWQFYF